uniref:Uncharacterized protein n=1 Tax=Pseudellipsoidion edaphicum TaxID=1431838 RepID=A0A3R5UAJ6_9STRA|nr:hypothetical protein [Pseudellipsoidion edaphicum]QAA12026.1 hypothetical protein [Pseudellipsoidion edaphicum]
MKKLRLKQFRNSKNKILVLLNSSPLIKERCVQPLQPSVYTPGFKTWVEMDEIARESATWSITDYIKWNADNAGENPDVTYYRLLAAEKIMGNIGTPGPSWSELGYSSN